MPGNPARLPGSPSAERILELLAAAGDAGMPSGAILRSFSYPVNSQMRNNRCNNLLKRLAERGLLRRSAGKEPSVYYRNTPQYRWFVTDAGREYPARCREAQEARLAARRARQEKAERATRMLQEAAQSYGTRTHRPERDRVIRELKAAGCTNASIGAVFGISREMVRLIVDGKRYKAHYERVRTNAGRVSGYGTFLASQPPSWRARWYRTAVLAVRERIRETGMSVAEISEASGVHLSTVYVFLRGEHASSPEKLERILAACGLVISVHRAPGAEQDEAEEAVAGEVYHVPAQFRDREGR